MVGRCQKCSGSWGNGMSSGIKCAKTPGMCEKDIVGRKPLHLPSFFSFEVQISDEVLHI